MQFVYKTMLHPDLEEITMNLQLVKPNGYENIGILIWRKTVERVWNVWADVNLNPDERAKQYPLFLASCGWFSKS